jgi:hypothetical protein
MYKSGRIRFAIFFALSVSCAALVACGGGDTVVPPPVLEPAPVITQQPPNLSVPAGTPATFGVLLQDT